MTPEQHILREVTRRHFFNDCRVGLGALSLGALLSGGQVEAAPNADRQQNPLAPRIGHFPAKAKQVIYLFMAGGPSQLELFDFV